MGEVYSARDPRLDRVVAIKVLLDHTSLRPEARARFEREARAIASLDHPHICVVHDIGSDAGTDFIVMELLEGETLARGLERGALPLHQALRYAIEIADALDKAHRSGITHRDLKPGNVMLTKNGVKLLDFGLAKLRAEEVSGLSRVTTVAGETAEGTIVGSLQYMAPEQLEGGKVDARADIFAFGAVLYEMVTGVKAFDGKSAASIISAILRDVPKPVSVALPSAPTPLARLIATCLEKAPDDRWQNARDLHRELKWIATAGPESATTSSVSARTGMRSAIPLAVAALLTGALTGAVGFWLFAPRDAPPAPEVVRFREPAPAEASIRTPRSPVALSSDGGRIAFVSGDSDGPSQLYVRDVKSLEPLALAGTDGAYSPFFSPDNRWLGFFANNKLKRVSASGGTAIDLCDASLAVGAHWAADDTIYFAPDVRSGLRKVRAGGGRCEDLTRVDRSSELSHRWPQLLPGGRALLFNAVTGGGWDNFSLKVLVLQSGEIREVVPGARNGRYVRSGHIVYSRAGRLMAAPFDLDALVATGPSVALPELVTEGFEGALFDVSDSGSLAYVPAHPDAYRRRLVWVSRTGSIEPLPLPPRGYLRARISDDGRRAAIDISEATSTVSIYDFSRSRLAELTATGFGATWTHDSTGAIYASGVGRSLVTRAVDGSGAEKVVQSGVEAVPGSVTPDGKWLVYHGIDPATGPDIWRVPLDGTQQPSPVVKTAGPDIGPRLSSDGRWLAYEITDRGRRHVYVSPFPSPDGRVQVSTEGGTEPVWSRNGRELFYRWGNKMMAVEITVDPVLSAGTPRQLFEGRFEFGPAGLAAYDVAADGRFLMVQPLEPEPSSREIHVVLNWYEELKRLVPAR